MKRVSNEPRTEALIIRSFWGLFIAVETMRIVEELMEIWLNEVCDTRLLANEGPAIYVVHLNRYFVILLWYYLVVTFLWHVEHFRKIYDCKIIMHRPSKNCISSTQYNKELHQVLPKPLSTYWDPKLSRLVLT